MARSPSTYTASQSNTFDDVFTFDSTPLSTSLSGFTIVCRHNPKTTDTNNAGIFGNWDGGSGNRILIRVTSAGTIQFYRSDSTPSTTSCTSSAISDDTWVDLAFRWDGTDIAIWIDGSEDTASASTGGWSGATVDMVIGYKGGSQYSVAGNLSNYAIYDYALSDVALASIAAGSHPLLYAPAHFYPMDGDGKDYVAGNDLSITGSGSFASTSPAPPTWRTFPAWPLNVIAAAAAGGGFQVAWATRSTTTLGASAQ